jgi:hypothetical protein
MAAPRGTRGLTLLSRLFHAVDRRLPAPAEIAEVFERERPDLLLVTPLLYFRSHQVDHVRHARARGIKSIVGIGSWDHLTTKGLIHEVPDRVLVWNEAQKQEAIDLHAVPGDRVIVTGSQAYDHWFDMRPSVDRQTFCARVGLDAARPILLILLLRSSRRMSGFARGWPPSGRAPTRGCAACASWCVPTHRTQSSGRRWTCRPSSRTCRCGRRPG